MRRFLGGVIFAILTFILWMFLLAIRFDYVVHVMYPGEALGEPIWFHDPFGFWIISIACCVFTFAGIFLILTVRKSNHSFRG
ncbi:MAG: hypothetical protein ACW98Y_16795 [Candidatus Thorarchaeota archaeon]|jgi:hypothetical protein